jgi:uncharacterized membrane protein YadS
MVKIIVLAICVILLFSFYATTHKYKSEYVGISQWNPGFILGTLINAIINGFAWYYIFKIMTIIE